MLGQYGSIRKEWHFFSKFNMEACGNWKIECSIKRHNQTGEHEYLCYHVKTKEGYKLKFIHTTDGLHALEVDQNTDGFIF